MYSLILRNFLTVSSLLLLLVQLVSAGTDFIFTPVESYHFSNNLLDSGGWLDDREDYLASGFGLTTSPESKDFSLNILFEYVKGSVVHRTFPVINEQIKFSYPFYKKSSKPFVRMYFNRIFYRVQIRNFTLIAGLFPLHISPVSIQSDLLGVKLNFKKPGSSFFSGGLSVGRFQENIEYGEGWVIDMGESQGYYTPGSVTPFYFIPELRFSYKVVSAFLYYAMSNQLDNYGLTIFVDLKKLKLAGGTATSELGSPSSTGFAVYGRAAYIPHKNILIFLFYGESSGYDYKLHWHDKQYFYRAPAGGLNGGYILGRELKGFSSLRILSGSTEYVKKVFNLTASLYFYWNNTIDYMFEFNDYNVPKPCFLGSEGNISVDVKFNNVFFSLKYGIFFPAGGWKNLILDALFWHYRETYGYERAIEEGESYDFSPPVELILSGGIEF